MTRKEVSIRIGGAAGDGVASAGEIFARTCSRSSLHVYAYNSYQSVIRGGHVWFQVRAAGEQVLSVGQDIDILIALNTQTVEVHLPQVVKGGAVIYDPVKVKVDPATFPEGVKACPMPLLEIAKKYSTNPILANTVALGAAMQFIGTPIERFVEVVRDNFGKKAAAVIESNDKAAREGFAFAQEKWGRLEYQIPWGDRKRLLLTGNQAVALGAMAAGCKFYSFYPMTPATSIGQYLASNGPKHGVVVKQAEDEIAVINMAIGAGFAGARAMCGTSGGGFALMVEAMGLAGMSETPIVVALSQRSGPSTGLPTKTEQGDLNMMMGAGQGDYPRIVLAPRNVEEAYYATVEAFNLAEKWQTPVILALDLLLSEHFETVDTFRFDVPIERGPMWDGNAPYLRYKLTDDGVSPRAFPGAKGAEFIAGSDEHDEDSTLVSDVRSGIPDAVQVRVDQMVKRMRKLDGAVKDLEGPRLHGPQDAPVTLVYWGSTQGAAREAMATLASQGIKVNALEFKDIFPLPVETVLSALQRCKHTIFVEGNYTGQFQRHVRAETGFAAHDALRKFDGEPLWPEEIVQKVKDVLGSQKTPLKAAATGGR